MVREVTPTLDYLVVLDRRPNRPTAEERKANALNGGGAAIQVLDWSDFRDDSPIKGVLTGLALSADGRLLAVASDIPEKKTVAGRPTVVISGGEVTVWDTRAAKKLCTVPLKSNLTRSMCFSPDGKSLAVAGLGNVLLLDSTTGKEKRPHRFVRQCEPSRSPGLLFVCFATHGSLRVPSWIKAPAQRTVPQLESTDRGKLGRR